MSYKFNLSEGEREEIRNLYLREQNEEKRYCHAKNVKSIDEIIGDREGAEDYIKGVKIRKSGVNGLTDMVEALKTIRLYPSISDGGEHLAYQVAGILKGFKPYNYHDETQNLCQGAIDKIIQLYKENEHGEELVKDLEKVYASQSLSPKAKEYTRFCIEILKNKKGGS
jgi:hypothetical protein